MHSNEVLVTASNKPPFIWVNVLVFSLTALGAVLAVPLYGILVNGYDGFEWAMFAVFGAASGTAITGGFHRLWAHRAYEAHPVVRVWFALWGAAALQNSVLNWCTDHRRHHRHVDDVERDPYAAPKGFWFSHLGWMLREYRRTTEDFSNVRDLQRDPVVMWQERHYLVLVLVMNLGLPALLGWLNGDLLGMVLMAGLLRLVVVHHFTFFINSLAHMWGKRPYSDQTTARDNPWVAFLTFGEGYHNYHHSFQWDYRNGIRWWHFDPTKWMIRGLSAVRLTHGLKRCSEAKIERAKAEQQLARSLHKAKGLSDFEIWSQRLHHEYEHLVEVINAWSESRQRWTEAKADQLMHQWELVQIKRVYVGWKANLLEKKRSWTELTEQLAGLSRAAA